jgi:hypothetical protein
MENYSRPVKNLIDNFGYAAERYGNHPLFLFERGKVDYEISYKILTETVIV